MHKETDIGVIGRIVVTDLQKAARAFAIQLQKIGKKMKEKMTLLADNASKSRCMILYCRTGSWAGTIIVGMMVSPPVVGALCRMHRQVHHRWI